MGVTGQCSHAEHLKRLLTSEGINVDTVQSHACYQTIVKTRIIARQQHVVRIDLGRSFECAPGTRRRRGRSRTGSAAGGGSTPSSWKDSTARACWPSPLPFMEAICELANRAGKILAVDPNPHNPLAWRHVSVIKPPNCRQALAIDVFL